MTRKCGILFLALLSLLNVKIVASDIFLQFSPVEKKNFLSGKIIRHEEKIRKKPWPKLTLYALRDFSPMEGLAVFSNFKHQASYVPNMLQSDILNTTKDKKVLVAYEIKTPWPVPNAKYVQAHSFFKKGTSGIGVRWSQVKSNSASSTEGSVIFYPYKGKSIIVYNNFVVPNLEALSQLFSSNAIRDMESTFKITLKEITKVKKLHPKQLENAILKVSKYLN